MKHATCSEVPIYSANGLHDHMLNNRFMPELKQGNALEH